MGDAWIVIIVLLVIAVIIASVGLFFEALTRRPPPVKPRDPNAPWHPEDCEG